MRIALYTDCLGNCDGHTLRWAKTLQGAGHEVVIFSNWGRRIAKDEGIAHTFLAPFGWHLTVPMVRVNRALMKFMPDVVVCVGQKACMQVAALKESFPKVVALICGTKKIKRALIENYRQADLVVSDTFMLQGILLALGGTTRVEVISKSISLPTQPDPAARLLLRRKMGADEDTVVVLCKQPLELGFSHHYLMECFACINSQMDAQLWLVGKGRLAPMLRAYARILDPKRIKILSEDFASSYYYSAADAAATASPQEDLSQFLIDAHAFGLPGICQSNGGCAEVVMNGMSGWVSPPDNEPFFVGGLQEMIKNGVLRQMMSQNARSLSFRFDPHRQSKQLVGFIEGLGR